MKPKIALYVSGGVITAIRSNIGSDLEIEIVDSDNDENTGNDSDERWDELQTELSFGNY